MQTHPRLGEQCVLQHDSYSQSAEFRKRMWFVKIKQSPGEEAIYKSQKACEENACVNFWFLKELVELAALLCQHWTGAKADYVIAIMPENQQISTDKLCRSKDLFIIFATGLIFYEFLRFIWFHLLPGTPNTSVPWILKDYSSFFFLTFKNL